MVDTTIPRHHSQCGGMDSQAISFFQQTVHSFNCRLSGYQVSGEEISGVKGGSERGPAKVEISSASSLRPDLGEAGGIAFKEDLRDLVHVRVGDGADFR